jgi:hypothetical protein
MPAGSGAGGGLALRASRVPSLVLLFVAKAAPVARPTGAATPGDHLNTDA